MSLSACGSAYTAPDLPSSLPGLSFQHVVIDSLPPGSENDCCTDILVAGDFNGDGRTDLAVGSEHAGHEGLVWYEAPHWTRRPIASGDFTTDAGTADIDEDGDLDIVASRHPPGVVEWWENTGEADHPWRGHPIGNAYAHDLLITDVNGDGRVDVVKSSQDGVGGWYEAPPSRTDAWTFHEVFSRDREGLAAADLDADGDIDLLSGRDWFENADGSGLRWAVHAITRRWSDDTRVALGDFNDDGFLDVVLSYAEGIGRLSWFENSGRPGSTGTWGQHAITTERLEGVHSLQVRDFDGDGDLDVAAGEMHRSPFRRILLFRNDGGDTWTPMELGRTGTHNAIALDLNSDGDLDLVGKNYAGRGRIVEAWENMLYRSDTAAGLAEHPEQLTDALEIEAADSSANAGL